MKSFIVYMLLLFGLFSYAQEFSEKSIGDKVAEFSGIDDQGKIWSSSNITNSFLVVYFYPAAMTGGCTKQACAYRDDKAIFDKLDIQVIGVSGDEVKNLKYFKEAYDLNFALISDREGSIAKTLGVPTNKGGTITREIHGAQEELIRNLTTPRWTFILDNNHTILYKNASVNAAEDSKKVLEVIKNLTK